ncbi:MAG: hypothetical protein LGR52_04945 [Candidatus Thiosymbion ectosymbiont of Robbea hypermnestra]|nr:hypothetical protein [Candidatus Thiosymbion ectosymbiont of Robbea hypermnestra]
MITKDNIGQNVRQLARLYDEARKGSKEELYYSKLAVLELCGWIEESMDDIILKCCNRTIKRPENRNYIRGIVKRNYAFEYPRFREMLISVIGLSNVEKVEKRLDPIKQSQLEDILKNLKGPRNNAAHTHIKGTAMSIDAPSVTIRNFTIVYDGLKNIETTLHKMGL